mmetsp:Transcript_12593/g.27207  ORF Transcript_12593/g.27207 Transcript_12593/m.27207 type:complete len:291 (-) Transcript_12593:552-1424(-)|eukprot:CAMPEP_0202910242 /NCGR_PEP_ID=MMETSP1392-20130828/51524_1 /ASSEMBLY_ACC=CAM_ASM_000868 /TAXON_ID=225041 /ORGANISM="Chlamydomonas chlamydogama, Strain SAG 11-48b" /LENGTH=290 /DNA_ID=CAMNT_0049600297 /DNA_START=133 /DNA_END=1005 /DNA_ORIENTATION=+
MADQDGDLLVVLVDIHLFYQHEQNVAARQDLTQVLQPNTLLEQLLYFIGSYLLLHDNNQLAVYAVQEHACTALYLSVGVEVPGESFGNPYRSISSRLLKLLEQDASSGSAPGPMALSGALSRALCLIHRLKATPAWARARCRPRVLCMVGSPDAPMQYIPVMNAIFSAQRAEVAIDALLLHTTDSTFLQQAVHLTGGLYFKPSHRGAALQYLLQTLSADTHTRSMLAVHQPLGVDFRASCFCHKQTIDMGYVCSVCLSIFCQPLRACAICGTPYAPRAPAHKRMEGLTQA